VFVHVQVFVSPVCTEPTHSPLGPELVKVRPAGGGCGMVTPVAYSHASIGIAVPSAEPGNRILSVPTGETNIVNKEGFGKLGHCAPDSHRTIFLTITVPVVGSHASPIPSRSASAWVGLATNGHAYYQRGCNWWCRLFTDYFWKCLLRCYCY